MALTKEETVVLADLLWKMEWPLSSDVFHALMAKAVSVPIELCVLNNKGEVLMFYRKDPEYDGYNMPGTVLRDTDTVDVALKRLVEKEVRAEITTPIAIGWMELPRGIGWGMDPARHEISLIHVSHLVGEYTGEGKFFPMGKLPEHTIVHHRKYMVMIQEYLKKAS